MAYTVDIRDKVSAALRELQTGLDAGQIAPAIGRAEVILFQKWYLSKPNNKQGFPSTGMWAQFARATNFMVLAAAVLISTNHIAARQRYQGGDIKPTGDRKYLTIPARAEAYGKRAREFDDLKLAFRREGSAVRAWALVTADKTSIDLKKMRQKGATVSDYATREYGGAVMFWLVKIVHQQPDPSVIPPDEMIFAVALETIEAAVLRAFRRGGSR